LLCFGCDVVFCCRIGGCHHRLPMVFLQPSDHRLQLQYFHIAPIPFVVCPVLTHSRFPQKGSKMVLKCTHSVVCTWACRILRFSATPASGPDPHHTHAAQPICNGFSNTA